MYCSVMLFLSSKPHVLYPHRSRDTTPLSASQKALGFRSHLETLAQLSLQRSCRLPAFLTVVKPETHDVPLLPNIVRGISPCRASMEEGVVVDKEDISSFWHKFQARSLRCFLDDLQSAKLLGCQRWCVCREGVLRVPADESRGKVDLKTAVLEGDQWAIERSDDLLVRGRSVSFMKVDG